MPTAFTGQLNSNEIFSAIYNMIISQRVFADNIKGTEGALVDMFRTDGSMYGDSKLFYATDILKTHNWLNDNEAGNLLALDRPQAPACQVIKLDQFRQIRLTVDQYLSKRAWADENTFASFTSVMLGWIGDTKRVYDSTLVNAYVGNVVTAAAKNTIDVPLSTISETGEAKNRLEAQTIAQYLADTFVELNDVSRDYNEYKYLRSYVDSDFIVVWNSKYVNKITKIDLPTIFHNDSLINSLTKHVLPSRYFGIPITSSNISSYTDSGSGSANKPITSAGKYAPGTNHANGTLRSLIETDYTVSSVTTHVFPGDELPTGAAVTSSSEVYFEDKDIICKVIHKDAIKFMSAFEVSTEFFNPRSLTENHYLTFGYSKPDYLKNYPIIVFEAE